jgi:hypothetical protein
MRVRAFLRSAGLPADDLTDLSDPPKRFPDGAHPTTSACFVRHHEIVPIEKKES